MLLLDGTPPVGGQEDPPLTAEGSERACPFLCVTVAWLCCPLCTDMALRSLFHVLSSLCQQCFSRFLDTWFSSSKVWHLFCARNSPFKEQIAPVTVPVVL